MIELFEEGLGHGEYSMAKKRGGAQAAAQLAPAQKAPNTSLSR